MAAAAPRLELKRLLLLLLMRFNGGLDAYRRIAATYGIIELTTVYGPHILA